MSRWFMQPLQTGPHELVKQGPCSNVTLFEAVMQDTSNATTWCCWGVYTHNPHQPVTNQTKVSESMNPCLPCAVSTTTAPTGLYEGVPVSIVTTLMGMPNMDFVVREARAAVAGQMAIVRLGTCGALRPPARLGSFMVASPGAVCVR